MEEIYVGYTLGGCRVYMDRKSGDTNAWLKTSKGLEHVGPWTGDWTPYARGPYCSFRPHLREVYGIVNEKYIQPEQMIVEIPLSLDVYGRVCFD